MKMGKIGMTHVLIAVLVLFALVGGWALLTYNGMINASQGVNSQWANVESSYQRRADLIPNLVATVSGYMKYESGLLANITALRSQWGAAKTPEEKIAAGSAMDSAISRLLVVAENYPELKASANTQQLMDELAGTENRISVERMKYNDAARSYNVMILYFPNNVIAGIGGFHEKAYFKADEGAQTAPKVNLG